MSVVELSKWPGLLFYIRLQFDSLAKFFLEQIPRFPQTGQLSVIESIIALPQSGRRRSGREIRSRPLARRVYVCAVASLRRMTETRDEPTTSGNATFNYSCHSTARSPLPTRLVLRLVASPLFLASHTDRQTHAAIASRPGQSRLQPTIFRPNGGYWLAHTNTSSASSRAGRPVVEGNPANTQKAGRSCARGVRS